MTTEFLRSVLHSTRIPQPRRYAVDGELNPAQHLLVRILRAMLPQELDLHVVERVEIGETVAHRALQQRIALQQPFLPRDVEQRLDHEMPFPADAAEDA